MVDHTINVIGESTIYLTLRAPKNYSKKSG